MAGVGFELKKLFRSEKGYLQSIKAYTVSAMVTEGPMLLNILMLFLMRFLLKQQGATVKEQDIFLYTITYIMIFSLIFSNTALMFIDRYISDCLFKKRLHDIMPAFFALIFWLVIIGGMIALIYLLLLPVDNIYRIVNLFQFCIMMIIWVEVSFLSAVKQYNKVMIGFLVSVIVAVLMGMGLLIMTDMSRVMAALLSTCAGYMVMMIMFYQQMLTYYPSGEFNLFQFFPELDQYKILVAIGFFMALGLYAHNFVVWTSEFRNKIWDYGVFCTKYDVPTFFATLTISPMLIRFVVSVETNFYASYREYFDAILHGGTLQDIRIARHGMMKVLFREVAQMMEIQFFITVVCATFLGNYLGKIGMDEEQTSIFRILCFGYCLYGLAKCLIILLLYFEDRGGALVGAILFTASSTALTAVFLNFDVGLWGCGYLLAAFITVIYASLRLGHFLNLLEYKVFLRQPLFYSDEPGLFERIAIWAGLFDTRIRTRMEKRFGKKFERRRRRLEKKKNP